MGLPRLSPPCGGALRKDRVGEMKYVPCTSSHTARGVYRNDTETLLGTSRWGGGAERTRVCLIVRVMKAGTQSDLCILYHAHSSATHMLSAQFRGFEWPAPTSTPPMNFRAGPIDRKLQKLHDTGDLRGIPVRFQYGERSRSQRPCTRSTSHCNERLQAQKYGQKGRLWDTL